MQKALTNKTLEALKPQAKRYEVHDIHCPGMSVRVSAQGQKVFSVKFRYGLDQKRMKLGVFPRITLATAREKAMDILRQVDEGIDLPRLGLNLCPSTLLRLEAAGQFPKRVRIGAHSVAWLASEIHEHIAKLAAERGAA
jgi:predicted DNA-binding transcriptional regulator AlpA